MADKGRGDKERRGRKGQARQKWMDAADNAAADMDGRDRGSARQ